MILQYGLYTPQQQWVWQQLFGRQTLNLQSKGTSLHNDNLLRLRKVFNGAAVPYLNNLSDALYKKSGWQIHIVKGFIPAVDFLCLPAEKKFAAGTGLRKPEELDYLEEPDMFHDVFGHLPVLCDEAYASFVHRVGALGKKYSDSAECIDLIERSYRYTIEFGPVKENNEMKIFGAGIISSFGETNRIFEHGSAEIRPFCLKEILYLPFDKAALQPVYYVAESFDQVYTAADELENVLEVVSKNEVTATQMKTAV